MTVADFIEWLKTQDQGATVEVIEHSSGHGYYDQGGNISQPAFDPSKHAEYVDMRGNPHVTPDKPYYNTRTLLIGSRDN